MTSSLLSKLARFSAFPNYMWDMALHYPLLFPYGENGWHSNIPFNGVVVKDVDADLDEDHVEEFEHKKKHYNVTMAEFNGYRL